MNTATTTHTFGGPLSLPMTLLNWTLPTIALTLLTYASGIDWHYVAGAAAGSLGGSLAFGFFRREGKFGRQVYKTAVAWIGGIIVGGAAVHWLGVTALQIVTLVYFLAALVVLIFVRACLAVAEEHAKDGVMLLFRKVFTVPLEKGPGDSRPRRSKRKGVHVSIPPGGGPPEVKIDPAAVPDEVQIIEQRVIEKPQEPL